MKHIRATFNLINAWEEWLIEVPDDWQEGDPFPDDGFVMTTDAGNDGVEFTGEWEDR